MEPLISVIVPIYNVEKYLPRCVDSLLGQRYRNLELLLVDDGSTDGSGALCEAYAARDARVRVLHKPNGGLSDARNAGLAAARGEYLSFVDGDDWVSPYYLENLYRALEQADADFSASGFEEVFEGQPVSAEPTDTLEQFEILRQEACLKRILYQDGMEVTTPTKLYKKELFNGVQYPVGKLYEDIPVAYEIVKRSRKAACIANRDYYYFQRGDSIQNMAFNPRKLDSVRHCRTLMENVKRDFPQLSRAAECRYLSNVCNILFQIRDKDHEKIRKALWQEVKKYRRDVMLDPEARKKARLAAMLSYGGYPLTRRVYEKTQWRGATSEEARK